MYGLKYFCTIIYIYIKGTRIVCPNNKVQFCVKQYYDPSVNSYKTLFDWCVNTNLCVY